VNVSTELSQSGNSFDSVTGTGGPIVDCGLWIAHWESPLFAPFVHLLFFNF